MVELRSCPVFGRDAFVFSCSQGQRPVAAGSLHKVRDRLREAMAQELGREVLPFRPAHDFRVSAATRMGLLNVREEIIEAAQGRSAPALHRTYNKHNNAPQIRDAMDRLGEHIMEVVRTDDEEAAHA